MTKSINNKENVIFTLQALGFKKSPSFKLAYSKTINNQNIVVVFKTNNSDLMHLQNFAYVLLTDLEKIPYIDIINYILSFDK